MELSIPVNNINTQNIYFTEKKKNIIVDGEFIKILYSTEVFEMNGLYILIEFDSLQFCAFSKTSRFTDTTDMNNWTQSQNRSTQSIPRRIFTFNTRSKINTELIEILCQIEHDIIERYIASNCPSKIPSYILKPQLLGGTIKYHSECKYDDRRQNTNASFDFRNTKTILKISGIWETTTSVGITMKFILLNK
jgi:hypothetical protein